MKSLTGPVPVEDQRDQVVEREQARVSRCRRAASWDAKRRKSNSRSCAKRHLADQSGAVRRPVDLAVVHADQMPVAGQPHVAFDAVGALLQRQLVGGQGVLGALSRTRPGAPPRTGGRRERRRPSSYVPMLPGSALRTQPQRRFRARPRIGFVGGLGRSSGTITQRFAGCSTGCRSNPWNTFIASSSAASASR